MSRTMPETDALTLLRALFDLGDADIRITLDLLARLAGQTTERAHSLIVQLRRAKLVQENGLGLTMVGLAAAVALPEFEPAAEPASRRSTRLRAA